MKLIFNIFLVLFYLKFADALEFCPLPDHKKDAAGAKTLVEFVQREIGAIHKMAPENISTGDHRRVICTHQAVSLLTTVSFWALVEQHSKDQLTHDCERFKYLFPSSTSFDTLIQSVENWNYREAPNYQIPCENTLFLLSQNLGILQGAYRIQYACHILDLTLHVRKNLSQADPKIQKTEMDKIDKQALGFWTKSGSEEVLKEKLRKGTAQSTALDVWIVFKMAQFTHVYKGKYPTIEDFMKKEELYKLLSALWSVYATTYDCNEDEANELVAVFNDIYNVVHQHYILPYPDLDLALETLTETIRGQKLGKAAGTSQVKFIRDLMPKKLNNDSDALSHEKLTYTSEELLFRLLSVCNLNGHLVGQDVIGKLSTYDISNEKRNQTIRILISRATHVLNTTYKKAFQDAKDEDQNPDENKKVELHLNMGDVAFEAEILYEMLRVTKVEKETAVMLNEYIELARKSVEANQKADVGNLDQKEDNDERMLAVDDLFKAWRFLKSIKVNLKDCPPSKPFCTVTLLIISPVLIPLNGPSAWLNRQL